MCFNIMVVKCFQLLLGLMVQFLYCCACVILEGNCQIALFPIGLDFPYCMYLALLFTV